MNEAAFAAFAAGLQDPPQVRIQCPKRHYLITATIAHDGTRWVLRRVFADKRDFAKAADVESGWNNLLGAPMSGGHVVAQDRVSFVCEKCPYRGNKTRTNLLELYARTVMRSAGSVRLPD